MQVSHAANAVYFFFVDIPLLTAPFDDWRKASMPLDIKLMITVRLAKLRDSGSRDLVFLIGGPDGLAPSLLAKAQERLSFGAQTWPHLMVRAMLAEQLYRACAILAGHPYHRGSAGVPR